MEFDSRPDSATGYGFVVDFDSATDSDSITTERFPPSILQSIMDSSQPCDQLRYNMYMNTVIVGNLSGNVQIPHNCNTG